MILRSFAGNMLRVTGTLVNHRRTALNTSCPMNSAVMSTCLFYPAIIKYSWLEDKACSKNHVLITELEQFNI